MNLEKQKKQKDPSQKDTKFILELLNSDKLLDAQKEINKKLIEYPNSAILHNIMGAVLANQNQLHEAVEYYEKALQINPDYAQAYNNLGASYYRLNKINKAITCFSKALNFKKDFAEAYNNMGNAVRKLYKFKEAIEYFEKAIKIKTNYAEAYNNIGGVNEELGNKQEALDNYKKAIKINPNYADVYNNLGSVYSDLSKSEEALINYNKAISLKPKNEKFYNNLGNLFNDLGRYDEANTTLQKAIKIKPDYARAYSNLLFNLNYKVNFDSNLYLSEAKKFRLNCKTINKKFTHKYQYEKEPKKLRVGLVSADFGNHPGGFFTLSTLRELSKKNFEFVAYATTNRNDDLSHFFKPLFLKWNMVEKKTDEEIIEQIFNDGIHILMDLQGHSAKNRLTIFMYKAAPIQASWLGQGSTGIPEVDYFIGSPHITPENEEKNYVEKVLRLPEISQSFTPPSFEVKINELPAIKNNFITFGCANKLSKINDNVVSLWSKILLSIPKSKLLIKTKNIDDPTIKLNTFERFKKCKIDENRLILRGESKTRKELLEIYNEIDIALDPFPFQGNTSTCESVWMGVPVLILKGNRYLFHFGESINSNLGMQDWISKNSDEYITKAIKFSSNIDELAKIRKSLREVALKSPVFDASRLANHFDKILWDMWKNFNVRKN